jgi:hypothetical protein
LGRWRDEFPYIVIGQCEIATATYLSPAQRREIDKERKLGLTSAAEHVKQHAEDDKPLHEVWILAADPAVTKWSRGDRRSTRVVVERATLERVLNDYVRAILLVRVEQAPSPPTTSPASQPAFGR